MDFVPDKIDQLCTQKETNGVFFKEVWSLYSGREGEKSILCELIMNFRERVDEL